MRNASNVSAEGGQCPVRCMSANRKWRRKNGIREWRLAPYNGLNRVSPIPCCDDESRASFQYDGKHPVYVSVQEERCQV